MYVINLWQHQIDFNDLYRKIISMSSEFINVRDCSFKQTFRLQFFLKKSRI